MKTEVMAAAIVAECDCVIAMAKDAFEFRAAPNCGIYTSNNDVTGVGTEANAAFIVESRTVTPQMARALKYTVGQIMTQFRVGSPGCRDMAETLIKTIARPMVIFKGEM